MVTSCVDLRRMSGSGRDTHFVQVIVKFGF